MKKLVALLVSMFFMVGCASIKISGTFNMKDGSKFSFDNGKIKINNREAEVKTKTITTKIDMKKVESVDIEIEDAKPFGK